METGPIIIYEDDREEHELFDLAFQSLKVKNKVFYFDDGEQLIHYLRTTKDKPFLIIAEVRVAKIDGLELKEKIQKDDELRKKGIPFIYLSTSAREEEVDRAYELTVQGFFKKENTLESIKQDLKMILEYWSKCYHPNGTKQHS